MGFSGELEDFTVTDVMQYLHVGKKSGTLYLRKGTATACVLFVNGHIVRAARPGMTNLGDLLLRQGHLTSPALSSAVQIQKSQPHPAPLGMILKDMGVITHQMLRDAVIRQIQEVVYEVATWEEGAFTFELGKCDQWDDISVLPEELITAEELDTRYLLLEAMRLFDEIRNDGAESHAAAHSPPDHDPSRISNPCHGDTAHRSENYDQCLPLLKKMIAEGRDGDSPRSISVCFLEILSEYVVRAILFLVRRRELLGLGAIGETSDRRSLNDDIHNLRIPLDEGSYLVSCIQSGSPFLGDPPSQYWLDVLYGRIGAPSRSEIMVLPVGGCERVVCLVYGDNGHTATPLSCPNLVEISAGLVGMIFENAYLRKQLQRKVRE